MTSFAWDESKGTLKAMESVSTLQAPVEDNSTAEIAFHPTNAKVLYGSNRGHNSIARFSIDEAGKMKLIDTTSTTGSAPRHFGLHPSGKWMLAGNQSAETLVTYSIDPETGKLTQQGEPLSLRSPVCMVFVRIP